MRTSNYIGCVLITLLLIGINFLLVENAGDLAGVLFGGGIFIAGAAYHISKAVSLIKLIDSVSKEGNEMSQRQIRAIVNCQPLISQMWEFTISAIIVVVCFLGNTWLPGLMFVAYAACCLCYFVSYDIRGLVAETLYNEIDK